MYHENCSEFGLAFKGPPAVRRERVMLPDGRGLSALVWGHGTPELVFLHGGAQNAHTWDTVALALGRPLLCIDLPSHGHSDDAKGGVNNDPSGAAADCACAIAALAPHASVIIGMSYGGLTAIKLSAQRPELVRRLVLVDVTPGVTRAKAKGVLDFVRGPPSFASFEALLRRITSYPMHRSSGMYMLLTIEWGALLAAATGRRRRMRRLLVCLGRLPGRPSTLPTSVTHDDTDMCGSLSVVTEAVMSGWWWAPKIRRWARRAGLTPLSRRVTVDAVATVTNVV